MAYHGESGASPSINLAGEIVDGVHRLVARVYYADTDFSGFVYHARYLEFLERGRSDFLRLAGVNHTRLAEGELGGRIVWVVRHMEIDFHMPARMDDIVAVETRTQSISGARIVMNQRLVRGDTLIATATVEAAIVGGNGRPVRFPKSWIAAFQPRS